MGKMKKNCWEVKKCGREPGGIHVNELGICPAALETNLDGMHGGKNTGRSCWITAGTFCEGKPQGTFARKFDSCEKCDFFKQVKQEEYPNFYLLPDLFKKLMR